jgi:hypothetical protein
MKLKVRSDDASTLREHGLPQMEMGDWLAQLRDDSRDEPPGDGHAGADDPDHPRPEAPAQADVRAEAYANAQADAGARASAHAGAYANAQADAGARASAHAGADANAQADAGARASAHAGADASAEETGRAVIGDQLRMPIMWCEMGSCISWYTDPAALGEADTRARAIGAGWRIDALGRLACPPCQQTDPRFWASCPVVPWDRYMAIARASQGAVVSGDGATDSVTGVTSHDHGRAASGFAPVIRPERESHHDSMPAGGFAENPVATVTRAVWPWRAVRARRARGGQAAASLGQ